MSDEPTVAVEEPAGEPVLEAEVPEQTSEAAPPEPDPEAELAKREAELAKKEKALQKGFQEIADRERKLTEPPKEDKFAGTPDLDDDSKKLLDKYIESKYGPQIGLAEKLYVEVANTELDRFAESKGIDADSLRDTIRDFGFAPADDSIASMRAVFDKAVKVMTSSEFDADSERERIRNEERERLLSEFAAKGVTVDEVVSTRTEPGAKASLDDPSLDSSERNKLLQEKHAAWFRNNI